ncbi:hypothetical protein J683_1610 [Acinetobacter baumannii 1007214]|nr:hypothetical protein J510_1556 [Acinetobacter baumannii 466760]EXE16073.1 hypothetical protein J561_4039 [Acinetobacter baumannii 50595]EXH89641.1 hypothetical protein J609_3322 [Acinetobacter baumannii 3390]EXQ82695.1 hypothetical protein J683_1610 [Acinetobacter baumannii 1007214]KCY36396.1 hypothetical protein J726_1244 [Acinetobacter baumannii 1262761-105]
MHQIQQVPLPAITNIGALVSNELLSANTPAKAVPAVIPPMF